MLRVASVLGIALLLGCSSSGGSDEPVGERCATASDCLFPTPLCVENTCIACTENSHCDPARYLCLGGACWGADCTDDLDCGGTTPICDRGLCTGTCKTNGDCETGEICRGNKTCGPCSVDSQCDEGQSCLEGGICGEPVVPPELLIVLDRSGSMKICAPGAVAAAGALCDADGNGTLDTDGASRWEIVRGALADPGWFDDSQQLGLVVAGIGGDDPACGEATVLVPPGSNRTAFAAAFSNPALVDLEGGTPTAAALSLAAKQTASSAEMRAVLITDGLANCNPDHPMPCICANESGCVSEDGSALVPFLEEGTFLDGRFCLDDTAGLEAVQQLRAAGVRTAIVSVGESAEALAPMSSLAEAGGLRAGDATGIHHAADSFALIRVLQEVLAAE